MSQYPSNQKSNSSDESSKESDESIGQDKPGEENEKTFIHNDDSDDD